MVSIVPDGVRNMAQAVVSADRRYVRISSFPVFSELIDVTTFSFISGAGGGTASVGGGGGSGGGGTGGGGGGTGTGQ